MNAQQAINEVKQTIEVPPAIETAWKEVWNAKHHQYNLFCEICDNQASFLSLAIARESGWTFSPNAEFCPNHY